MPDTYETNLARIEALAKENGLILNPDPERVKKVVGLMANNYDLVQEWVCPCKQKNKPARRGVDTCCPCPEWKKEIAEKGSCSCRLFYAPETAVGAV
jgi:ferredoxin-thioredoxin reductase catalytic subunit